MHIGYAAKRACAHACLILFLFFVRCVFSSRGIILASFHHSPSLVLPVAPPMSSLLLLSAVRRPLAVLAARSASHCNAAAACSARRAFSAGGATTSTGTAGGSFPINVESYASYGALSVSSPAMNVLQIDFDRPRALNAFNEELWNDTREVFRQVRSSVSACVCVRVRVRACVRVCVCQCSV